MLRADVVVIEPLRFVLSESQDLASAVRKFVETIHGDERLTWSRTATFGAMLARPAYPVTRPNRVERPGPTRGSDRNLAARFDASQRDHGTRPKGCRRGCHWEAGALEWVAGF